MAEFIWTGFGKAGKRSRLARGALRLLRSTKTFRLCPSSCQVCPWHEEGIEFAKGGETLVSIFCASHVISKDSASGISCMGRHEVLLRHPLTGGWILAICELSHTACEERGPRISLPVTITKGQ